MIKRARLPDGTELPALGQGTWHMGERGDRGAEEIAALRAGLDLGLTLIDTAEMYGEGGAERIVGAAIAGRRDEVFLVSKVYPHNAGGKRLVAACEASLKRLGTGTIDLYLLHWRGAVPLAETVAGLARLREDGKIRFWGVSNLDADDMAELAALPGGSACATDQVLYNPDQRGIEFDLLAWCAARAMPVMAYTPLGQAGTLLRSKALAEVGKRHGATPAQVALAWCLRRPGIIAIPKAASIAHVQANAAAVDLRLSPEDLATIDATHPPPRRRTPLAML